jgi:hypothetical protein
MKGNFQEEQPPQGATMSKSLVRSTFLVLGLFTFLALSGTETASAQVAAVGGHVSLNQDLGEGTTWGVGARAHLSLPLTGVTLQGTVDFFSPDCGTLECDFQEASLNVLWSLPIPFLAKPYFGAGIAAQNSEGEGLLGDEKDFGANFLAGVILQGPAFTRFQPFGEVKYQMMQDFDPQTVFSFGMMLALF